jgi:ABC-type polysaccharide/polyol phosphate transport system ATPase subunit
MSYVNLSHISVEIPLRGIAKLQSTDPRIHERPGHGLFVRALRDISLEVKPGDRIGVMGSNGAGKSTLLRVIAGIIPVNAGTIDVKGNVQGILNITDGMRMALTGRENARLRYYLLGEPGGSLDAFVDDVISFADLGDFFDLPVSIYSPGMLSRLLFAMSTVKHADILLLDEWIGVADGAFRVKATQRLRRLVDNNDIFIVATHDLGLIREITRFVIVLDKGTVARVGSPHEIA